VNQYSEFTGSTQGNLVKSDGWAHGGRDVEGSDVLPLFLKKRDQEVNAHVDVLDQLIVVHVNITDGNSQAQDLLHLELDGGLHLSNLSVHVVASRQDTWKLTGLVQTWSQQSWNLSDQSIGSQESVVFFGELFDELFVLVEFFQVVDGHVWDVEFGGFINMGLVTEDANGEFWSSGVWQFDGTGESLVLLWIVVFEHDLKLNGFGEFSVFVLAGLDHFGDLLVELISVDFRHIRSETKKIKFRLN
jgi:hypothetical protein